MQFSSVRIWQNEIFFINLLKKFVEISIKVVSNCCYYINFSHVSLLAGRRPLITIFFIADASGLKEPEAVRGCQEKVVHALQEYTVSHYPDMPSKFGELLLRMPELSRVCQVTF